MVLICQYSICEICGKELGDAYRTDDVVGLPSVLMFSDFHMFDDSVIHQSCFQTWDKASEFVNCLNFECHESGIKEKAIITKDGRLEYV